MGDRPVVWDLTKDGGRAIIVYLQMLKEREDRSIVKRLKRWLDTWKEVLLDEV